MATFPLVSRVGVFDSGVGGITVLQALRSRFPTLDFIYLGDTANVPYGTKSPAQIEKLSRACALRLRDEGIQALVVACNTASSWAMSAIQDAVGPGVAVIGMVEPGVEAVLERCASVKGPILLLATRATVKSGAYRKAFREAFQVSGESREILEQSCPLLVPMIEEGWLLHPILGQTLDEYIGPHLGGGPGVVLLGCTHYPWIKNVVTAHMPGWQVVDSAESLATYFQVRLRERLATSIATSGSMKWMFTDPDAVPDFARQLMKSLV